MNILQMISKNDRYGAQRIFLDQVAVLQSMGHSVIVVVRGTEGYVTDQVRAMGLPCHGIGMKRLRDISSLRRLIKDNAIDVIHTTLDRADYLGLIVSWLTGIPVVSTMMVPRCHPGFRFMKRVIALSNKQRTLLNAKGIDPRKTVVIRPGIDVARFAKPDNSRCEVQRKKLQIDRYTMVFSHISSLLSRKAHMVSLDLIHECKKRGENPLLVIIGDPVQGEYYESLIKRSRELHIAENVHFTGWTSDIPEILSLSHFTVLPSENEALGVVLMEGMAAGTPIIAREGEGGAELIHDHGTGFLYKPDDGVSVLADEIVRLKRDRPRFAELSEQCRQIAVNEFSLARFGQRLTGLYSEIVKAKPGNC